MLLRPSRPLPKRFRRRVNKSTASFVKRRQQRHRQYVRERWMRSARRWNRFLTAAWAFVRQWLWLTVFTALAVALAIVLFSPLVRVREIRVRRTDPRLDVERIQKGLRPLFGKHLAFVSARDVQTLVIDALPDAAEVTVRKQYPSTLALTITLRPLIARLQIEEPSAAAASGAVTSGSGAAFTYLTDNGLEVSLPFAAPSAGSLPVVRVVDWAVRPLPSTSLVTPAFLKTMQAAEDELRTQFGRRITGRTLYLRAREFHLQTDKYAVWFDVASPLADQIERYKIFLKSVGAGEAKQYVDLRLVGKVVYR